MRTKIEELKKQYKSIVNQSALMITSVSDKVDIAKIEAGKISLEMVIEDLDKILNEAAESEVIECDMYKSCGRFKKDKCYLKGKVYDCFEHYSER